MTTNRNTQYQQKRRERLRKEGVHDYTVTAHADDIAEVRRYARELLQKRNEKTRKSEK